MPFAQRLTAGSTLAFLIACSSPDSPSTPSKGGSGNAAGGATTTGGAPTSAGGMTSASGGASNASGGVSNGGAASGGAASTGGNAAGGASSGGTTNGGASSGGTTNGGGTSNGAGGAQGGSSTSTGGKTTTSGGSANGGTSAGGTGTGGSASGGATAGGKTSAGGASGGANTGGSGGLPTVPDNGCNVKLTDKPVGFAAQNGGTVGGGNVTPILVTTAADFKTYIGDAQPRVLYVMNDLDFRTANRTGVQTCAENTTCDNGSGKQIDEPRVSATCDANEHVSTSYRYEVTLKVASNKTVIGVGSGSGAALRGASLNIGASQQVILRNLKIYDINPHLVEAGDGVTIQGAKFIWLDHLLLTQISDGMVDIGSSSGTTFDDNITLSWVHFDGHTAYQCGGKHHYVNFVDNGRVTYHHNWYDNGSGRNPKLGGEPTQVHLFNNYWLDISYFCITAQQDAEARVESNYFENSLKPHWRQTDGNGTAGIAIDTGNVYTGVSTGNTSRDTGGTVFTVPYSYSKETADAAKASVVKCSGPQPIR